MKTYTYAVYRDGQAIFDSHVTTANLWEAVDHVSTHCQVAGLLPDRVEAVPVGVGRANVTVWLAGGGS